MCFSSSSGKVFSWSLRQLVKVCSSIEGNFFAIKAAIVLESIPPLSSHPSLFFGSRHSNACTKRSLNLEMYSSSVMWWLQFFWRVRLAFSGVGYGQRLWGDENQKQWPSHVPSRLLLPPWARHCGPDSSSAFQVASKVLINVVREGKGHDPPLSFRTMWRCWWTIATGAP